MRTKPIVPELALTMRHDWPENELVHLNRAVLRHRIWSKQAEILRAVKKYPLVAVKSCHASGKTFTIAEIVLWWLARWQDRTAHRREDVHM